MFFSKVRIGVAFCCFLYFCVEISSFSESRMFIDNNIVSSAMFFPISISKGENSASVWNIETLVYYDENETPTKIIRKYSVLDELIFPFSDGLRQDFVLYEKLSGNSPLQINLGFLGKVVEVLPQSICIQDEVSNRRIQYSKLNVFDSAGRCLLSHFAQRPESKISIIVDDSYAVYPIYIDPTYLDEDWESMVPNYTEGEISSIVVDSDNNIYCGGRFTSINNVSAKRVAKLNGSVWQQMGNGFENGAVEEMCISSDNKIYAVGSFTKQSFTYYNRIAKWTGSTWATMGDGFDNVVYTVAVTNNGTVFAGGEFDNSGETPLSKIALWDGSRWDWSPYGISGGTSPYVNALTSDSNGNVYVGGQFQYAEILPASNIACWNGTSWSALGSGVNGEVYSLAVDSSGKLYVGGNFTQAGGISVNNIAIWDGTSWSTPNGGGVNGFVYAILPQTAQSVFIGGNFSVAGDSVTSNGLAWLYSGNWKEITSGVDGDNKEVRALALDSQGNLYVGGNFHTAGSVQSYNIAKLKKPPVFTITYSADTGGTISGASSQSVMRGDNGTEVTAIAGQGYVFDHWSDDLTAHNRTDTNITENKSFVAYFSAVNEGLIEGQVEGTLEGEGPVEGEGINEGEGILEGTLEGEGITEGEGSTEGMIEGMIEGTIEGTIEGVIEGNVEGIVEGEGMVEGTIEGEGISEGETELIAWIEGNNYVNRTVGDSYIFSVQVEGAHGELGYQWYYCKNYNCSNPVSFQQALGHELFIENLATEDTGWYWCQISDDFGVVETQKVYLQVTYGLSFNVSILSFVFSMFCLLSGYFYSKIKRDSSKDSQN